jgi:hypothetical protein
MKLSQQYRLLINFLTRWIPAALLIIILIHLWINITDYLAPWGSLLWKYKDLGSWERGVRFGDWMTEDEIDSISFIRDSTSSDEATLIPKEDYAPYSWIHSMKWNLYPREIIPCSAGELLDCIPQDFSGDLYVVRVEDYPTSSNYELLGEYYPFTDDFGVIHLDIERLKRP